MQYNFTQLVERECDFTKSPVWILGELYKDPTDKKTLIAIKEDIKSRLWFSYRKGDTGITSDSGWGCMMRSGQMLFSQAFINLYLGRNHRITENSKPPTKIQEIIDLFYDIKEAPYSIHKIAQIGTMFNVKVGDWFGPTTIANVLQKLSFLHFQNNPFVVYVSDQSCIYLDEIENLSYQNELWKPLIILMPLKLGVDKFNTNYKRTLCKVFEFPQILGVIGGKPSHSLYFTGCQDDYLFYLDPHTVQPISKSFDSYVCAKPKKTLINDIDPSLAVGFLIKDRKDFDDFSNNVKNFSKMKNSFIQMLNTRPKIDSKSFQDFLDEEEEDEFEKI